MFSSRVLTGMPALLLLFSGSNVGVMSFVVVPPNSIHMVPASNSRATSSPGMALHLFGGSKNKRSSSSSSKNSPLLEEALTSFPYEFLPENDEGSSKILTSTTKSQATKVFNEIARLYGDESALQMIKSKPICLCMGKVENLEASLNVWADEFGLDNAKAMVLRNPGLLAIPPSLAAEDPGATMALSYVVWAGPKVLFAAILYNIVSSFL